jgi:hypothetical protein
MGLMVLSGCAEGALDGFCAANVGFRLLAVHHLARVIVGCRPIAATEHLDKQSLAELGLGQQPQLKMLSICCPPFESDSAEYFVHPRENHRG